MLAHTYYDIYLEKLVFDAAKAEMLVKYMGKSLILPIYREHALVLQKMLDEHKGANARGIARFVSMPAQAKPAYYFEAYQDQTLQRAYELDTFDYSDEGYNINCIGWRNESNPYGFLAARGIIPGKQGNFVFDSTEPYEVMVPYEFTERCIQLGQNPMAVIRNWIADTCKFNHDPAEPRADGYRSTGKEAQSLMAVYLQHVYKNTD